MGDPYAPNAVVGVPRKPPRRDPAVPDTSVKGVMEWAGEDPMRLRAALRAEKTRPEDERRKTLITQARKRLGG